MKLIKSENSKEVQVLLLNLNNLKEENETMSLALREKDSKYSNLEAENKFLKEKVKELSGLMISKSRESENLKCSIKQIIPLSRGGSSMSHSAELTFKGENENETILNYITTLQKDSKKLIELSKELAELRHSYNVKF